MLSKLTKLSQLSMGFSLLQPVFSQYNKQQEQSLGRVHTSATGLSFTRLVLVQDGFSGLVYRPARPLS